MKTADAIFGVKAKPCGWPEEPASLDAKNFSCFNASRTLTKASQGVTGKATLRTPEKRPSNS